MKIHKLSHEMIGFIAAGEVVENPASAVKELVENSIDAQATHITVEMREGGITYLRVADNGVGIPSAEIRMAFERHATSKLSKADDLFSLDTLGFRGEALASIAAVSQVTLSTQTQDSDFGTRAKVHGGEMVDVQKSASPVGTSIVVEHLFYNTPVRKKFLKKPSLEAGAIADYMMRLILSRPDISFRLVSDGKTLYHSMGDGKLESALLCIYGKETLKQLYKVQGHAYGIILHGYVGVGELSRGNRTQQSFFVNGRYFKNALLSSALQQACQGRVMIGRFPICALFLTMPHNKVDVNVHPNKLSVRFQAEKEVADALVQVVGEAFQNDTLGKRFTSSAPSEAPAPNTAFVVDTLQPEKEQAIEKPRVEQANIEQPNIVQPNIDQPIAVDQPNIDQPIANEPYAPTESPFFPPPPVVQPFRLQQVYQPQWQPPVQVPTQPTVQEEIAPCEPTASLRYVGILFHTYWIFERGTDVLLVDQHAAHERILYERFLSRYQQGNVSQFLLAPLLVAMPPKDIMQVHANKELWESMGFSLAEFDSQHIALHAIPTFFGASTDPKALFVEVFDAVQAGKNKVTQTMLEKRVLQLACKHAIKGGDSLSEVEMLGFMQDLLTSEHIPHCPHGRPIVVDMSQYEIEKRFGRIQ